MVPLGKGFFQFNFASGEDMQSVWALGSCNLYPGILHLSKFQKMSISKDSLVANIALMEG